MKKWREPFFVLVAIVGLYALYLSQPMYSLPPTLAYLCAAIYAFSSVFRLKNDFDSKGWGALGVFLLRLFGVMVLGTVEFVTTLPAL